MIAAPARKIFSGGRQRPVPVHGGVPRELDEPLPRGATLFLLSRGVERVDEETHRLLLMPLRDTRLRRRRQIVKECTQLGYGFVRLSQIRRASSRDRGQVAVGERKQKTAYEITS